jgi:adenine-specific DNA-methyltransferase
MSRPARSKGTGKREVDDYRHDEALRLNNPEAGLARYETEKPPTRRYEYDPRMDPQLVWAGKAERTSFEVDAVSIHVHERLSTEAIVRTLRKEQPQLALFGDPELDRDREVEFYQHEVDWTNRLILGDSLVVMTSLLERERMAGQVQCIYFDPPYGINYNSNFQARISNRSPRDMSEEALTREPEQIQAYRDTWELGVHSYLTYLRDRLLTAKELLSDEGSIFVQIGPDRLHLVRALLDEVFGAGNSVTTITVQKTSQVTSKLLPEVADFLLWYAKDKDRLKYFQIFEDRTEATAGQGAYSYAEIDGTRRSMTPEERADPSLLPSGARVFMYDNATSQGYSPTKTVDFEFEGRTYHPGTNRHWLLRPEGMRGLADAGRLGVIGETLRFVRYADEGGLVRRTNIWTDTGQAGFAARKKQFVVETNPKIIERCLLMVTQPGDLVLDPTCGSGTTAYVAEKHGRRWITCDTSRVALSLARERLLTSTFPYYRLIDDQRGVDAGIRYERRSWVKASTIGYGDEDFDEIVLYDQPEVDNSKVRVSGPFTVEALSRYAINPLQSDVPPDPGELTATADHIDALLDALKVRGIPVKGGPDVRIATLSRLAGTDPLHAEGTTEDGTRFAVSVGPRYGPISRGQVDDALDNAYGYELVVFAGFTATPEVQSFLGKGRAGRYKVVLLEANADLLVADLLKNTKASQTFRLFAAPDVAAHRHSDGGVYVELRGVDVYDAGKGEATARTLNDIAAWFLDHDYDGEVFHVNQAFFPKTNAWEALARALKGTLDEEALAKLAEFQSNPFTPGEHRRAAVRVIDDSGQTSEAVVSLDV